MPCPWIELLCYVSKCSKLIQLDIRVHCHVNVIYSLEGGHTHTDFVDKSNFKKPGVCLPKASTPGLKILILPSSSPTSHACAISCFLTFIAEINPYYFINPIRISICIENGRYSSYVLN